MRFCSSVLMSSRYELEHARVLRTSLSPSKNSKEKPFTGDFDFVKFVDMGRTSSPAQQEIALRDSSSSLPPSISLIYITKTFEDDLTGK